MKVILEKVGTIISGKWHRNLLTPNWVQKNVFKTEKESIQVEFNVIDIEQPPRYVYENIRFIPSWDRVFIQAIEYSDNVLNNIQEYAKELCEKLPETPILAIGYNFSYSESISLIAEINKMFNYNDTSILSELKLTINNSSLTRQIENKNGVLNFTISQKKDEVLFDFNFHYKINNNKEITSVLDGRILKDKKTAEKILTNGYKLILGN